MECVALARLGSWSGQVAETVVGEVEVFSLL